MRVLQNRKLFSSARVVALLLVTAGTLAAQDVRYNFMPRTDFSKYHTYKWVNIGGAQRDQIMDAEIKQAVDSQLATKGMAKADSDKADLYIGYQTAVHQEQQWDAWGTRSFGMGVGSWTSSTISIGTLVLDMYDPATKQLVWTGSATKTIDTDSNHEKHMKKLDKAMAKLLKNYPPKQKYPQSLVAQDPDPRQAPPGPPFQEQTPEELQQLVAPIALYPDSLVAQLLAASMFPEQVVDADRWVQSHPDLTGEALAQAVDQLPWDPSVKALVAFPSVLGNMDKNLSWVSSLGDAYYNQEEGVMDAIQVMRRRAKEAGHLNSTPQQTVTTEDSGIEIEPISPEIVYVPAYDPWVVYGGPIAAWPGWYPYPGIWYDDPVIFFGDGFGTSFYGGYGWGWHHWGCDWHHHYALYDHARYYSPSRTSYDRDTLYRSRGERGVYSRAESAPQPFGGDRGAARGYAEPRGKSGVRSSAFSSFGHGGEERSFSSRGSASFGGGFGGGFHGGGRR